jgi:glycosyltransferase involved in cell wall biosynthesis
MFEQITPLILTYNEKDNIERTLSKLAWAQEIIVVDSFSTDDTVERAQRFSQVRIFQRAFDTHAKQWNFGLKETGISTDWILALDADYLLSDLLVKELKQIQPDSTTAGYRAKFRYCLFGRPLRSGLYPPVTVLYRRELAEYVQDGHTQRIVVDGPVESLMAEIHHDDRKPLSHWLQAQDRYMRMEAEIIQKNSWENLGYADRLRKLIVFAPFAVFFYCLLVRRGLLDGWEGLYYALQRMLAETLLSVRLIEAKRNGESR